MLISDDPVGSGLVVSLAKPGGNLTGMSTLASDMGSKRIELLKEVIPRASRIAALWNSSHPAKVEEWKETEHAAKVAGLALRSVEARTPAELGVAFAAILHERPDAMLTFAESLTISNREKIGSFALANRLPMIAELREFTVVGGLASYGISRPDLWRRQIRIGASC